MNKERRQDAVPEPVETVQAYEPPTVEKVLTADTLAREIQYAGAASEVDVF
jgi:hypothetical protein